MPFTLTCEYQYDQGLDSRWGHKERYDLKRKGPRSLAGPKSGSVKTTGAGGVCYALAILWIIKSADRTSRQTFWGWLGAPRKAAPSAPTEAGRTGEVYLTIRRIMEQQFKILDTFGVDRLRVETMNWARIKILGNTTLAPVGGMTVLPNPSLETMGDAIIASNGYKLIKFCKPEGGGHAVAAYVSDAGVSFMDPNFGEYTITPRAGFPEFLQGTYWQYYKDTWGSVRQAEIQGFAEAL